MSVDRRALDLTLYLVTDTRLCGDVGVAATARAAVTAGVTVVQLRDHNASDAEFVRLGRELVAALTDTAVPVIVNDRVGLVHEIGADGAHIGQSDLSVGAARAILGPDLYLGLSVGTSAELEAAKRATSVRIDYLGVGPVWAQSTKLDAAAPCGPGELRAIVGASPWPCVAIGGIDGERMAAVRSTGAAGAAVVSAICGQPDVAASTRLLLAAWNGGRA